MIKKISLIALAAVLAIITGLGLNGFAPSLGSFLAEEFLAPLAGKLLGLLIAVASFMVFIGLVNSICSMENVSTFGNIGKRVVRLFGGINLIALVTGCFVGLQFFDVYRSEGRSDLTMLKDVYKLLLDIIPTNLIEPFITSNTVQIVFLAVCSGIILLLLGERARHLEKVIQETNDFILLFIEKVCLFLPIIVYLSLTSLILSGKYLILLKTWKYLACSAGLGLVFVGFRALWLAYRCNISALQFLKDCFPIGLLGFTTGSGVACFPIEQQLAEKQYGVDPKLNMFAFSLGQTIYSPITIMVFWSIVFGMAEIYGVGFSLGSLCMVGVVIFMMATAIPNIPSSALTVLGLVFVQAGIPAEALAIATLTDVFTDMIIAGAEEYCMVTEIVLLNRTGEN